MIFVHPMSLGPGSFGDSDVFSAFYPLGCLTAYAKAHEGGALREHFSFGPVTPTPAANIPEVATALSNEPGIFLLSSYVWNHHINMQFARTIKERAPTSLVIVGGPHIPRNPAACAEFFRDHPYVDVAARHEGEVTLAEILRAVADQKLDAGGFGHLDLSGVTGITHRSRDELVRTPDRVRNLDLSGYPSPYTTGEFDHWLFDRRYLVVETNRGCPYGCTFCDWGAATLSKIARFSMERVQSEVDFAARQRIRTIGICDANFGVLQRDLDIARHIIKAHVETGWPKDVGYTNAKSAKSRLLDIAKELRDAGLSSAAQISMQTTDETILQNVERANIKTSEYRKMIAFFHAEGIPAASDMMLGLPGQSFETCRKDLQFFFDHKVLAVIFATSIMPNAPMADKAYQERFRISVGEDGMVESTYSFTRDEYAEMFDLCLAYKLFVKLGLLKYFLYYAQIEHGLPAMDFVAQWVRKSVSEPDRYPLSARLRRDMIGKGYRGGRKDWLVLAWSEEHAHFLFDDPEAFQREILGFIEREHGLRLEGSALEAVLKANREILPRKGPAAARRVALEHDVPQYFADLRKLPSVNDLPAGFTRLRDRPEGVLEVAAAPRDTYAFIDFGLTAGEMLTPSNLDF